MNICSSNRLRCGSRPDRAVDNSEPSTPWTEEECNLYSDTILLSNLGGLTAGVFGGIAGGSDAVLSSYVGGAVGVVGGAGLASLASKALTKKLALKPSPVRHGLAMAAGAIAGGFGGQLLGGQVSPLAVLALGSFGLVGTANLVYDVGRLGSTRPWPSPWG